MTRILVIFGACAGLCYTALWYFPVLILIGGLTMVVWDVWLHQQIGKARAKWDRRRRERNEARTAEEPPTEDIALSEGSGRDTTGVQRRTAAPASKSGASEEQSGASSQHADEGNAAAPPVADTATYRIPLKPGVAIIAGFLGTSPPPTHSHTH